MIKIISYRKAALVATFVLAPLFSSWEPSVFAGEKTGNGSDNPSMQDSIAWFESSDRVIRYCWVKNEGFGLKDSELESSIQEAFGAWDDYLRTRKINHSLQAIGATPLSTRASRVSKCDGTEDLRFYFGASDKNVERLKSQHSDPTAFSALTSFDQSQRWGKGLIWLAMPGSIETVTTSAGRTISYPNWQSHEQIQAILRHELGHALGCAHVTGTIMDENLSQELVAEATAAPQETGLTSIDRYRQLFVCWECSLSFSGEVGWTDPNSNDDAVQTFRTWTGRSPVGAVTGKLLESTWRQSSILEITDSIGSTRIELEQPRGNEHPYFTNQGRIFSSLKVEQVAPNEVVTNVASLVHTTAVIYTFGKTQSGTRYPVMIEINSDRMGDQGPVSIKYFTETGVRTLFRAQTQEVE